MVNHALAPKNWGFEIFLAYFVEKNGKSRSGGNTKSVTGPVGWRD